MNKALLVIDVQNDYFPGGKFPLWNTEATLANIVSAIKAARAKNMPVIHVQHLADANTAPFFNDGTEGARIHPRVLEAAPDAPILIKHHADGFFKTALAETLTELGVTDLLVCGMMTQNCVTHTAISKSAEKYHVTILTDCCTTVDEMIHKFALNAVSTRLAILPAAEAI